MGEKIVALDGHSLTIESVEDVARKGVKVSIHPAALKALQKAAQVEPASTAMNAQDAAAAGRRTPSPLEFSAGLNVSAQPTFTIDQMRAGILVQINHFVGSAADVRLDILDVLLDLLNFGVIPHIPLLEPCLGSNRHYSLARIAAVIGELGPEREMGASVQAWHGGDLYSGVEAMRRAGLKRVRLSPRELGAFQSQNALPAAVMSLALVDARRLTDLSLIAGAMSLEALLGASAAFDERLHAARPHPGQQQAAARVRELTTGSTLLDSGGYVQDGYSLRCMPQVTGPTLELMQFAAEGLDRELNPAPEEPVMFGDVPAPHTSHTLAPITLSADYLKVSLTTISALSERRIFRLISDHTNRGLPAMLVANPDRAGLESGLMMLQYSAAALVHENQALAAPDLGRPPAAISGADDVATPTGSASLHLNKILDNLRRILAMEMITAAQALDLRLHENPELQPGSGVTKARELIREHIAPLTHDRPMSEDIEVAVGLLGSDRFITSITEG